MRPDWADGEIAEAPKINSRQVDRLLRMTRVLHDPVNLEQAAAIKRSCAEGDAPSVVALWSEFSEAEQEALYIAPRFGGIFTTAERKVIKTGVAA